MLHVVLFEPEIPPNTGNIIRLCANTGATLHLIKPLGFRLDDKSLQRSALDYHDLAAVAMLPVAGIADRFWTLPWPSPTAWGALAGIALLCTVLAYILYFRILAAAGATNLLLVTLLLPVSALLLGNVVLGEAIQPAALAGMGLIGLGLAAIDGRLLMLFRSRALKSQLPPGLE